ncbi:MAG: hypothetical protein M0Z87_08060 [Actinomycetota bacterium]|nr:hypothetical protein [Actinomycetota bacterium]
MLWILHPPTLSLAALVDIGSVSAGQVLFDLTLIGHVSAAVVGFSAITLTGLNAHRLKGFGRAVTGSDDGSAGALAEGREAKVRQFFAPGPNLASRSIYLVAVAGLALLVESGRFAWALQTWLVGASALWLFCVVVAEVVLWPAERAVQQELAAHQEPALPSPEVRRETVRLAGRIVAGAIVVDLGLAAAFALMAVQPR